jgi:uncharacterized protein (DUF885 family)
MFRILEREPVGFDPDIEDLMRRAALASLLATLFAGSLAAQAPTATDAARVTALADRYVAAYVAAFPEDAEGNGMTLPRHDGLTDNSLRALESWRALEDSLASALATVNVASLVGTPAWVTHGFLSEALGSSRAARVCRNELWSVNHMFGWQANLAVLAEQQPVGSASNRADALSRWGKLPAYADTEIANLRTGVRAGYTAPRRLAELVVRQLDELLRTQPEKSPLFGPAARDSSREFRAEWAHLLSSTLWPVLTRYRDYLRDEYAPAARTTVALVANPDGLACYRASFRRYTSLDRAPEETYRLGERTVARYEGEAKALGRRLLSTDDLDSIAVRLRADPANHLADRDAVLAYAKDAVERARRDLPKWFDPLPRAPMVVTPYPEFLERTASSSYTPAALDGSRPATFRIVLYQPRDQLRSSLEILAAHEAYPGHHLQIALAQELPGMHPITQLVSTSAFIEGWARYAEALAEEMGLYTSDRARIARRMWPAHGMVVDPGIHVFGWSRERAVRFIRSTGIGTPATAESLVDRIIAMPGQLTSYDTGGLLIFSLRERAQRELGPRFDIKRFHAAVLGNGSVTLPMLEQQVNAWIEKERR